MGLQHSSPNRELSHKIRTILTVIRGSAELLEAYGQSMDQEERQALFSDIYNAVEQIAEALPDDHV
jgi:K+-sensing histidine kinase KdpD